MRRKRLEGKFREYSGKDWSLGYAYMNSRKQSRNVRANCKKSCIYAKSLQSCPTLCDPMDCSLPGYSVHGIRQARILEWGAMSSSRGSTQPRDPTCISCGSSIVVTDEPLGKPCIYYKNNEQAGVTRLSWRVSGRWAGWGRAAQLASIGQRSRQGSRGCQISHGTSACTVMWSV